MTAVDHQDIGNAGAEAAPMAGRREWIGLAVLALACLVYAMDVSVLNLAGDPARADEIDDLHAWLESLRDCSAQGCRDAEDAPPTGDG